MKSETFFEKFDQLVDAPGAPAQLRKLVLQLAMRGKLVPQYRSEGDAQVVLERIERTGKKLDRVQLIGVAKTFGSNVQDWYSIPPSWRWTRLDVLGKIVGGGTPRSDNPKYFAEDGIPWLTPADLNGFKGKRIQGGRRFITKAGLENSSAQLLPAGTVLFSSRAPIGYVAIAGRALATNQGFKSCIPYVEETAEFLYYFLLSAAARIDREASGTTFREVSGKIVGQISVPLPPLAEQKRIVEKVDELMALCDRLEEQQREREVCHSALTYAAVTRFNEAPALANLNWLFHGSYSVPPLGLRESILSVAVRGKLDSQNSNDEPATSLVEAIAEFRSNWLDGRRDKSLKRVRDIDNKKCSYDIPASWTWCRLGDIVLEFRYGTSRKCSRDQHGVPVLRIPNIQAGRVDARDLKFTSMPSSEFTELQLQRGDLLVVRSNGSEKLVGRSAVVFPEDEQFVYAGYLVRLRIPKQFICPRYLQLALSSAEVRSQIEGPIRTTSGVKNINTTELSNLVFPLAPFAEQRRIVDRIDRLTPLVDKLEAQLAISQGMSTKLLDAAVHEILHSEDGLVAPSDLRQDSTTNRLSIGCYVINQLTQNSNFGRTMLMKMFYLSEAHVGLPQAWQPLRQAAGPYDPAIEDFESLGSQSGLFTVKTKTLGNGHEMVQYQSKSSMSAKIAEAISVLGGQQAEFDRLLNLFQKKTTEEAEIIATLFAAWNDLLIDGKSPSDDEIIREVRENWHYKKERFTPTLLTRWLNWLRQQSIIPKGLAPRTRQQLKLGLS
jgi:type I restriction enzyme S subunit